MRCIPQVSRTWRHCRHLFSRTRFLTETLFIPLRIFFQAATCEVHNIDKFWADMEFPSLTTWFIPTLEGKNNTTGLAGGGWGGIHFPDTSREISDNVECYVSTNIQTLSIS